MHSIINDILNATKKRILKLNTKSIKIYDKDKRDIISSIRRLKKRGKVPIIAEIKPVSHNLFSVSYIQIYFESVWIFSFMGKLRLLRSSNMSQIKIP